MKKICLVFLFIVISLVLYGQTRTKETTSSDGNLKAICYTELMKSGGSSITYEVWESTKIEIYKQSESGKGRTLDRTLNIYDIMYSYKGQRHYVAIMGFNADGTKLYFSSRLVTYEYDIENNSFKPLFEDFNTRVSVNDIQGDTLYVRNVTKINYWGNKFWKYVDGKYIEYVPDEYFDYLNAKLVRKN
jgi:hypothetical protein